MAPHHIVAGQENLAGAYGSAQHTPYSSQYPHHAPPSFQFSSYGPQMPLPSHPPPMAMPQGHSIVPYHVSQVQSHKHGSPASSRSHINKSSKPLPPAPSSLPAKPPGLPAKPPPAASSSIHHSSPSPGGFKPPMAAILNHKGAWNGNGHRESQSFAGHNNGSNDRPWKKHGGRKKKDSFQKQPKPEINVEAAIIPTVTATPITDANTSDIEEGEISMESSPVTSNLTMSKTAVDDCDKSEGEIDEEDVSQIKNIAHGLPWRKSITAGPDGRRESDSHERSQDNSSTTPSSILSDRRQQHLPSRIPGDRGRGRSRSPVSRSRLHKQSFGQRTSNDMRQPTSTTVSSTQKTYHSHQSPRDSRDSCRESSQVSTQSRNAWRRDSFSDSNSRHTEESRYRSRSPITPRGDYKRRNLDIDAASDEDEELSEFESAILGREISPKAKPHGRSTSATKSGFKIPKRCRATVESRRREDNVYGYVNSNLTP
ncbi:hypothetical protein HOO65_080222 [Ceratocystis lukuohia]|uniref:Uncharacterized protein n=1 Tax=Ceratocystis lukuohia TaxID=2019550 RepID=A0ABR4MAH2_9PEZI